MMERTLIKNIISLGWYSSSQVLYLIFHKNFLCLLVHIVALNKQIVVFCDQTILSFSIINLIKHERYNTLHHCIFIDYFNLWLQIWNSPLSIKWCSQRIIWKWWFWVSKGKLIKFLLLCILKLLRREKALWSGSLGKFFGFLGIISSIDRKLSGI